MGHDSYVRKHVEKERYQTTTETDKVPIQNKTDIIKYQLDKSLSMLPLPDRLTLPTSEVEIQ